MPNDAVFYSKKLEILDYALLDHAHLAALSLSSLTLVNHLTFLPLSTIQMQNLAAEKQNSLVPTKPATVYVKAGKKVGCSHMKDQIGKSNTKID